MSNKAYAQYTISDIYDGEDGVGILSIEEQYYKSTSNSTQTGGSWSTTQPTWENGKYIWTRSKITWDNDVNDPNHITYTTPVLSTTYQSLYTDVTNRISNIATQDNQGNWSLTNGVIENTYVYTDSNHTNAVAIGELGATITTTKDQILSTVSNTYATQTSLTTEANRRKATYVTSSTGSGTGAKVGTCSNFELYNGATITCVFSNANTAASPTLNVNGTGAKEIKSYTGATLTESEYKWPAGSAYTLVYDGTNWRMQDSGSTLKISTAQSEIRQNADNIELKVSKDGVISSINQSSESVTIDANRVNITGDFIVGKLSDNNKNAISANALNKANASLVEQKTLYYLTNSSTAPNIPASAVSSTSTSTGVWTTVIPTPKNGYTYYTCTQTKNGAGTYAWIGDANNKGIRIATDSVIANWCSSSDATYINGGKIYANSITTSQLATDAIKSLNYSAGPSGSPYSAIGTFLDLQNGNFYTPNFAIDNNANGNAYINGEIIATSGRIGDDENTAWTIGTYTNSGGYDYGSIIANGDAFIQSGKWMISQDRIDTRWYNSNGQMTYLYDSSTNTYYDYGMNAPTPSSTTRLGDTFLYIRKNVGSIPINDSGWTYLFRVDKDGTIYSGETAIAGPNGDFLSKSLGGTVAGNVTFTGTVTGIISQANKVTNSLSINGKTYDGSTGVNVGAIGASYGGTGQTSLVNSANVLLNALSTGASTPTDNDYYISQYVNGGTTTTTYHRRPMSALWAYIKSKISSDHSNLDALYVSKSGDSIGGNLIIDGSLTSDEGVLGSLIVNGDARFVSPINGDLNGNAATATTATTATKFSSNRLVALTGDTTGSASSDGTSGWSIATTAKKITPVSLTNVDLNNYHTTIKNEYYYGSGSNGTTNNPLGNGMQFGMQTYASATGHVAQELSGFGSATNKGKWIRWYQNSIWTDWEKFVTSENYTDYTVTKTGGGASGTWSIDISGKATKDGSGNTITSYYAPKSTAVTNVAYDSTNKKITKTINGTTSDVVAVSTIKSEIGSLKNPNALKIRVYSGTSTPTDTNYDGSTANQSVSVASYNAITGISASTTGGSTTFTITKANGGTDTFDVSISGAIVTGATSLSDSSGNLISKGSSTKPVYFTNGTPAEANTYAGGTAVTLNGSSKASSTASFYAPTEVGTSNYILKSNGSGAPTWVAQSTLSVGSATTASKFSSTRTITLTGDVTGSASSDGTSGWSIATTVGNNSHTHVPTNIVTGTDGVSGGLDPITAAYIGSASSNKSFGLPAAAIVIEYSTDGGSTWTTYPATDNEKRDLFNETRGKNFTYGNNASLSLNNMLRVTIEPTDRYTSFHGVYVWMSTGGNTCAMDLERSTIGAKNTFSTVFTNRSIAGWSGNNILYFSQGTFGGGSTQTGNQYKYRLTFKYSALRADGTSNASISDIRFLGYNVWSTPNNMVSYNHMYKWDRDLNVTFPAQITASQFNGNATSATYSSYPKIVSSNEIRFDASTKPSSANTIHVGYKWSDGTSDSKISRYKFCDGNGAATQVEASTFYGSLSGNATSATKATNDSDNNPINTTYAKLSGATFTGAVTTNSTLTAKSNLIIQGTTSATTTYDGTNPKITFKNTNGDQNIQLIFTDYDSVVAPASLTLVGNQSASNGGERFIVPNVRVNNRFEYGTSAYTVYDSTNKCINFIFN